MIHYFFVVIPGLLFEPIAVCTAVGAIAALWIFRKNHDRFYWIIAASIGLMLLWRLVAYPLMLSSRYSSVLLYPAIIFTGWLCTQLRGLVEKGAERFPRLKNRRIAGMYPVLSRFLVFLLVAACLGKCLHYNPYAAHIVKISEALASEIKGKDFRLYLTEKEAERISYYAKLDYEKAKQFIIHSELPIHDFLRTKLNESKNFFEPSYFVFYQKKAEAEPDAQCLKLDPRIGKWECLHREDTSRRKNKELVLYRFTPAHPDIEIWDQEIPPVSLNNLCRNGDYERVLSGKQLEQRIAEYKKIGASDFYLSGDRFFPADWSLGVWKPAFGKYAEMALTEKNPVAGKYSLEVNSNYEYGWGTCCAFIPKQDCVFSGFLRAESDALIRVRSCYWNVEEKKINNIKTYDFLLHAGKTYRFTVPICVRNVPERDKDIFIMLQGSGHVLLDNIECLDNGRIRQQGGNAEADHPDRVTAGKARKDSAERRLISTRENVNGHGTRISALESGRGIVSTLVLPTKLYAVTGQECNVYFDNIFKDNAADYELNVACSIGRWQNERFTVTPVVSNSGTPVTLTVLRKGDLQQIDRKVATLYVADAATAGRGKIKKVSLIGDSLMEEGVIARELRQIASSDVMGIKLIGTRGNGINKHEGRGGWTTSWVRRTIVSS